VKTNTLIIHEKKEVHPEILNLSAGSTFIDYKD